MSRENKIRDKKIIEASKRFLSATHAASFLKMDYNTFKNHAKRLNCFRKNPGGKGTQKTGKDKRKYSLAEIFSGKYPNYQSNKLRKRLFKEKIKERKCEGCGRKTWRNKQIPLELHHDDGNNKNHKLENLIILCPNCHAQTETYKGKNNNRKKENR